MDQQTPDQRVRDLAEGQDGLVTDAQARRCGLSPAQVRGRTRQGALVRVHPGVLRLPGSPVTVRQRALAACWSAGPDTYASHQTGAVLWGGLEADEQTHVTVPAHRRPRTSGVVVHRSRVLRAIDVTRRGKIPILVPARTLLDIAPDTDDLVLASAVDRILRSRVVGPEKLLAYLADPAVARFGDIARLRDIALDRAEHGVTESELEVLAVELIRRTGFPQPVRQHWVTVGGRRSRIDLAYPDRCIGVELDSRMHHQGHDPSWTSERQNVLEQMGWRFLRFVWEHLTGRPGYVIGSLADALGVLPTRWAPPGGTRRRSSPPTAPAETEGGGSSPCVQPEPLSGALHANVDAMCSVVSSRPRCGENGGRGPHVGRTLTRRRPVGATSVLRRRARRPRWGCGRP